MVRQPWRYARPGRLHLDAAVGRVLHGVLEDAQMIDPDLKADFIRHAAGLGLFFCILSIICVAWQLANGAN